MTTDIVDLVCSISSDDHSNTKRALEALDEFGDDNIFVPLKSMTDENDIVKYLCSLLALSSHNTEVGSRRRFKTFRNSILVLQAGRLSPSGTALKCLLDNLFANIPHLRQEHARDCIETVFASFVPSTPASSYGYDKVLEMLPQLASKAGGPSRIYTLEKLCTSRWPRPVVAKLSSVLVELSESESECIRSMAVISSYIQWNHKSRDDQIRTRPTTDGVDPEELPSLVYHITALSRKDIETRSSTDVKTKPACFGRGASSLKRVAVQTVSQSLDRLLREILPETTGNNEGNRRVVTGNKHAENILATVVTHLSLIIAKDQGLAMEILNLIKTRNLYETSDTPRGSQRAGGRGNGIHRLSLSKLLLCILAGGLPRLQSKVTGLLCDLIGEGAAASQAATCSIWYDQSAWGGVLGISPQAIQQSLEALVEGPYLTEVTLGPVLGIGFALIDRTNPHPHQPSSSSNSGWTCLSDTITQRPSHTVQQVRHHTAGTSVGEEGVALICRLFESTEHIRTQVVRNLIDRLHACAYQSSQATASSSACRKGERAPEAVSSACVTILHRLSATCPHGLMQVSRELLEIYTVLPSLQAEASGLLVTAMVTLIPTFPALADRMAMGLRKACFCKDSAGRQCAVTSLLSVLRAQISQQRRVLESSGGEWSQGEIMLAPAVGGLSGDEILSMSRRFLQQQASVRACLYHELYALQRAFETQSILVSSLRCSCGSDESSLKPFVLTLLTSHLKTLMMQEPGSDPRLDLLRCDDEAVLELIWTILSLAFEALPQQSLSASVRTLREAASAGSSSESRDSPTLSQSSQGPEGEAEAWEGLRVVWSAVKSVVGLEPQEIQRIRDVGKVGIVDGILEELLWAGLVVLVCSPDRISGGKNARTEAIRALAQTAERFADRMNDSSTQTASKSSKSGRGSGGSSGKNKENSDGNHDSSQAHRSEPSRSQPQQSQTQGKNSSTTSSSSFIDKQHLNELRKSTFAPHFILLRADCVQTYLDMIAEEESLGADEPSHGLSLERDPFLHHWVMAMTVKTVEDALTVKADMIHNSSSSRFFSSGNNGVVLKEQVNRVVDLGKKLCPIILRDLMRQRTYERDHRISENLHRKGGNESNKKKIRTGGTMFPLHHSRKQSVLRSLLGCIRLETILTDDVTSTQDGGDIDERVESNLASILDHSFKVAVSTSIATARGGVADAGTGPALAPLARHFLVLLLSMHTSDDDEKLSERLDCPLVAALLGEIVSVTRNARNNLLAFILKQLREKLSEPSSLLSTTLIQLFLLQAPSGADDRLIKTVEVTKLINACAMDIEGASGEDTDAASYGIVSRESLGTAAGCILNIIDKVPIETDQLFKQISLQQTLLSSNKSVIEDDGNILFEGEDHEEDDDPLEDSEERDGRISVGELENRIARVLFTGMETLSLLLTPGILQGSHGMSIAERILGLFIKMFKCVGKLAKRIVFSCTRCPGGTWMLPKDITKLGDLLAETISPAIQQFLTLLHTNQTGASNKRTGKQANIVPELIYQMEQLDVQWIKLQSVCKGVQKEQVSKWIRRTTARDFRISGDQIASALTRGREAGAEDGPSKRRKTNERQDGGNRRGSGRRRSGGGDDQEDRDEEENDE